MCDLDVSCQPGRALGSFDGHSIYGIKGIAALGSQMTTVVRACAEAARSVDARDKYFMTYVPSFDSSPAKVWASEVPSLEVVSKALLTQLISGMCVPGC